MTELLKNKYAIIQIVQKKVLTQKVLTQPVATEQSTQLAAALLMHVYLTYAQTRARVTVNECTLRLKDIKIHLNSFNNGLSLDIKYIIYVYMYYIYAYIYIYQ